MTFARALPLYYGPHVEDKMAVHDDYCVIETQCHSLQFIKGVFAN